MPSKELFSEYLREKVPNLDNKIVAITGTTSGTGYWTAVACITKHAKCCILLNRQSSRVLESISRLEKVKEETESVTELVSVDCDLASFDSVRNAATIINQLESVKEMGIDALINNAGVAVLKDERTIDGFDLQMQINHLSHFLLTKLLLPSIAVAAKLNGKASIVMVSSGVRKQGKLDEKCLTKDIPPGQLGGNGVNGKLFRRYGSSKIAITQFGMMLGKKLSQNATFSGLNIIVTVAGPGLADTDIHDKADGRCFRFISKTLTGIFFTSQSAADGAMPLLECAFGEDTKSGDLIEPEHDGVYGKPVKMVEAYHATGKNNEKNALDEADQQKMWTLSELAIGENFF